MTVQASITSYKPASRALKWLLAGLLLFSSVGCANFPNADPPKEIFSESDYNTWIQASRNIPPDLVGTWRSIEANIEIWYRFKANGVFEIADEDYFQKKKEFAEFEGAYRVAENNKKNSVVCHFQRSKGDNDWIQKQGGKGKIDNYSLSFNDKDTLVLGNQTTQNLLIKFKRVNIKNEE